MMNTFDTKFPLDLQKPEVKEIIERWKNVKFLVLEVIQFLVFKGLLVKTPALIN